MIHHYLTKYYDEEKAKYVAESWIQINILGFCWCISKKVTQMDIAPSIFTTKSLVQEIIEREGVDSKLVPNETCSKFEVHGEAIALIVYD